MKIPNPSKFEKPTEVHDFPCDNCPSMFELDPGVLDILRSPEKERLESVFACAWRPEKLCKGYWDLMNQQHSGQGATGGLSLDKVKKS